MLIMTLLVFSIESIQNVMDLLEDLLNALNEYVSPIDLGMDMR